MFQLYNFSHANTGFVVNIRHKELEKVALTTSELPLNPELEVDLKRITEPKKEQILCCKACMTLITKNEFCISIEGHHEHMQCNPHGLTFIFRCFSQVENCQPMGSAYNEHSWFKDYAWTLVMCKHCGDHLGWRFTHSHASKDTFWGLISSKLNEILQS